MECEELRRVPETTEKQKLEHVRRTRIDTVWRPFRLKPCPGSNHSATEWRRKSFPDSSVLSQADMARGFRAYNANLTPVPLQGLSLCRFREAPSSNLIFCSVAVLSTGWVSGILPWIHCTEGLCSSPSSDLCVSPRCGHIKLLLIALAEV